MEMIKNIVVQCVDTKEIWLSTGGEPLLVPQLPEIIRLIKEVNPRISVGFNTNAALLTERRSIALVEAGLDAIRVSFDGLFPLGHLAGGLSPMKFFANISTLNNVKQQLGSHKPILQFAFVAARDSIDGLLDTLEMANSLDARRFGIVPFWPLDASQNEQNIFRYKERARETFQKAQSLADRLGIELVFGFVSPDMDQSLKSCDYPFRFMVVKLNGDAYVCCNEYPIKGNVNEQPIAEIWNSKEVLMLRKRLATNDLPEYCLTCKIIRPSNELVESASPAPSTAVNPLSVERLPNAPKPSWGTIARHTTKVVLDKLNLLQPVMRLRGKA